MGRKTLCTQKRIDCIGAALKNGASYKLAAQGAGISETTFQNWMRRADKDGGNYAKFKKAVFDAEAEGADYLLRIIMANAIKDWKAAAWMLERRHGYTRNMQVSTPEIKQTELPTDPKELLLMQMKDLKLSMSKAMASESWQAYAALQRQLLRCISDLKAMNEADGTEALAELSDEQLINEITGAVVSLPPILRQKLEANILEYTNVVSIRGSK